MSSGWRRTVGNVRSFIGNSLGGLRGGSNVASWIVAGTLAYYLWIKPSQDLKRQQEVCFATSFHLTKFNTTSITRLISLLLLDWIDSAGKGSTCQFWSLSLHWEAETNSWSTGLSCNLFFFFFAMIESWIGIGWIVCRKLDWYTERRIEQTNQRNNLL
jgi:hypothetical protein